MRPRVRKADADAGHLLLDAGYALSEDIKGAVAIIGIATSLSAVLAP